MTDDIERLRRRHGLTHDPDQLWDVIATLDGERQEAADEIERLRAEVKRLRNKVASLKGFLEEEAKDE